MAKKMRLELNSKGIGDLLKSRTVLNDLTERGQRIQNAAGGEDLFRINAAVSGDRARVFVTTNGHDGRVAEAQGRSLTNAISAGR